MNCKITLASSFSGLPAGISQISPAQLAATVRKSNLDRPFILPMLARDSVSVVVTDMPNSSLSLIYRACFSFAARSAR